MNPPSVSIRYFKMGSPIKLAKLPEDLQIEENYKKKKKKALLSVLFKGCYLRNH